MFWYKERNTRRDVLLYRKILPVDYNYRYAGEQDKTGLSFLVKTKDNTNKSNICIQPGQYKEQTIRVDKVLNNDAISSF